MNKNEVTAADVLKNLGIKNVIAALLVMLLSLGLIAAGGYFFYSAKQDAINGDLELSALRSAKEADRYLSINSNEMELAGYNLERIMKKGGGRDEIFEYLIEETAHIKETIDEGNDGVYGYLAGEFLHPSWTPYEGFVATERPWYIQAVENSNDLTYIKPYFDVLTESVMMTITYRLSDKTSVLAIDISLEKLQEVTSGVANSAQGNIGMILADDGYVVAHSDITEREKEYSKEENTLGGMIFKHLTGEDNYRFEVRFERSSYIVYVVRLDSGWNAISVINADVVFRPLRIIIGLSVFIALVSVVVILLILFKISKKNLETQNLNIQLSSIADIYISLLDINIDDDSYRMISCRDDVDNTIDRSVHSAQAMLNASMDRFTDEMSKPEVTNFINLSTLPARLGSEHTVTEEFLNSNNIWCRARFIAAERKKDGGLSRVLWVIESIDAEKRRRDKLQYMSETDLMTGINNRVSGERKVSKLIDQGYGGMFIMLDADKFKSINDTFGHDVGDKVIIAIANSLKRTFRSDDVVMRLGGDEFAAYAVEVYDRSVGELIINRLFEHINRIDIPELGDRKICISVGAAFYQSEDRYPFSELYKNADNMTYVSKKTLGNCVTYFGEE